MIKLKDVLAGKDLINEGRKLQDKFQKLYLKENLSTDLYSYIKSSPQDKFIGACQKYGYTALMRWFASEYNPEIIQSRLFMANNAYSTQEVTDFLKKYKTPEGLMNENPDVFGFLVKLHEKMISQHHSSPSSSPYSAFIMKAGSAKGVATWLNFTKVQSPKSGWLVADANIDSAKYAVTTGQLTGIQPDLTSVGSGGSFGGGIKTMGGSMSMTGGGYGIAYLPEVVNTFKGGGCVIVFQSEYVRAYDVNTKNTVCIFDSESVETPIPIYNIKGQATIYGKKGSPIFQGDLQSAIRKSIANGMSNYQMVGVKRGNLPIPDSDSSGWGF